MWGGGGHRRENSSEDDGEEDSDDMWDADRIIMLMVILMEGIVIRMIMIIMLAILMVAINNGDNVDEKIMILTYLLTIITKTIREKCKPIITIRINIKMLMKMT